MHCSSRTNLISIMKTESERHAAQNGREFKISEEELCAFLSVNILMESTNSQLLRVTGQ